MTENPGRIIYTLNTPKWVQAAAAGYQFMHQDLTQMWFGREV